MLVKTKTEKMVIIEMTEEQASMLRGYFAALPLLTHVSIIKVMAEKCRDPMNEAVFDLRTALDDVCHI